jgi:hypothetical protein
MLNVLQWFPIDKYDKYQAEDNKKSIGLLLGAIRDFEFSDPRIGEHPWDAWKYSVDDPSERYSYVAFQVAREMHGYAQSDWANVADVTRIGVELPEGHGYADWYVEFLKKVRFYRLRPESVELLERSFKPVLEALDGKLAKITEEERAENIRRERIKASVKSCDTTKEQTTDEGGKTMTYYHIVTMHDGTRLQFKERNLFDVGRIINPNYNITPTEKEPGGLLSNENGILVWQDYIAGEGWYTVRELTENEATAMAYIKEFGPYAHSYVRM